MSASQPYSPVARGRMPFPPWARIALLGGAFLGGVSLMTWVLVMPKVNAPVDAPSRAWSAGTPLRMEPPALPVPAPVTAPVPPPVAATPPQALPTIQRMQVWGDEGPLPAASAVPRAIASAPAAPHVPPPVPARSGDEEGQEATEYAQRMRPTRTADYEAGAYRNISFLLSESTTFGCLPQSPIDTQLVGGVSCIVDEDVWSADGTNILIDKGAIVSGEIQKGLMQGQDRAFLLWRSVRSRRVYATLNSPAVDQLGQMGVPGEVNEHLWQKIKATVLLTGIEGLASAGQSLARQGGGNNYLNLGAGQSLASQSLAHDINVPVTLWRGQAWPLKVYVQHNVWFKKAYNNLLVAR